MRNTFIRVRVRDEYSVVSQEAQRVIEEVIRQEGALVEVKGVEARKVRDKVEMIHVV